MLLFEQDIVPNLLCQNGIFSKKECKKIIEENPQFSEAKVGLGGLADSTFRQSEICWLDSNNDKNQWIYQRVTDFILGVNDKYFKFDLFGMQELQLTKYEAPNMFYCKHTDKSFKGQPRKLSMTIQLSDSDNYEGGDLVLYGEKSYVIEKDIGSAVVFPSYTLHEVTPVTKGTRYSLVGWVLGKSFK
jgi:PKHD-type hydroxylase